MGYLDNAGLSRFTAWVKSRLSGKQDKLTGTESQFVGFDAAGDAVPVPAPEGLTPYEYAVQGGFTGTEEQFLAQLNGGPYLPLSGGMVTGNIEFDWNKGLKMRGATTCVTPIGLTEFDGENNHRTAGLVIQADNYFNRIAVSKETDGFEIIGRSSVMSRGILLDGIDAPTSQYCAANKGYVDSAIQTAVAGLAGAKIATGSYVGTGTFGATSPTVIDCGFKPKFLLCTALTTLAFSMLDVSSSNRSKFTDTLFWVEGMSIAYIPAQNGSNKGEVPMTITQTDTGISFYVTQGSFQIFGNTQLNANNTTYFWLALG